MKKLSALFLAVVMGLSLFLLAGCKPGGTPEGTPLPEGMTEAAVIDEGRKIVKMLVDEQYFEIVDLMRSDVAAGVAPGQIRDLMESINEKAGKYVSESSAMATGQENKKAGEPLGEAVIFADHEKKQVRYRVVFDTQMNLVGLQIRKY